MATNVSVLESYEKKLNELADLLNPLEKEIDDDDENKTDELVRKYKVLLENNTDKKELVLKCITSCDELKEYITKKKAEIKSVEKIIDLTPKVEGIENFPSIINKKKNNLNQVVKLHNAIKDKIKELKKSIYEDEVKELNNTMEEIYGVDKELLILYDSKQQLKGWSGKNSFKTIFDSKKNGNGSGDVLLKEVWNRSNLYFISFDNDNNVYGGYIGKTIDKTSSYSQTWTFIRDENAFVFSLIRNGEPNIQQYKLKQGEDRAFAFFDNSTQRLFNFGIDVGVHPVGDSQSCCACNQSCYYNFGEEKTPLTNILLPNHFEIQRIMVIQMQ